MARRSASATSVFDDAGAVRGLPARRRERRGHRAARRPRSASRSAPGRRHAAARAHRARDDEALVRGRGANTRYVCDILPQTEPAEHLLVVEVRTPRGHSSSYPPHKHDTDDAAARKLARGNLLPPARIRAQGFAFQRVYTDDRSLDESLAVEDHDVVMVPRGYHPVVVPYGYESYYLNVMAGPTREWHFQQRSRARMDAEALKRPHGVGVAGRRDAAPRRRRSTRCSRASRRSYDDAAAAVEARRAATWTSIARSVDGRSHRRHRRARAAVQPSAVVRFAQRFGYPGFSAMQAVFRDDYTRRRAPLVHLPAAHPYG